MEPAILCLFGLAAAIIPVARWYRLRDQQRGLQLFRLRRELLEAKFFDLARTQGKPRDLRWVDCDWQSDVRFARDRQSGLLTAFVSVNIRFEAIEGGDMEGLAAVETVRDAVAVFHYRDGVWGTGGRALFTMNADDAVRNLALQYEAVNAVAVRSH
jgi:hypothetical protein